MKTLKLLSGFAAALVMSAAFASGDSAKLVASPHDTRDGASLQRGAQLFVNHCQGCHSAQYVRYGNLQAIGLTEKQILDNLAANGGAKPKIGDLMTTAMKSADAKAWFGAVPPDLSVIARSYGTDKLYSYLTSFYRDDARPTGWNNLVSPNIGMPHVLAELSGPTKLKTTEFANHDLAAAASTNAKGVWRMEKDSKDPKKYLLHTLEPSKSGKQDGVQYGQSAADLTNFLAYIAEPHKSSRMAIGVGAMIFLTLLAFLAYALKAAYWKDVH